MFSGLIEIPQERPGKPLGARLTVPWSRALHGQARRPVDDFIAGVEDGA
jgi:hypothetical protein